MRLRNHIKNALNGATFHCPVWIRTVLKTGHRPVLKILEKCKMEEWKERECYWINYYKNMGCDLTNNKGGGDGADFMNDHSRQKMSLAKIGNTCHKGFKNSQASKTKMSSAAVAKFMSPIGVILKESIRENQKKAAAKNRGLSEQQVKEIKKLFAAGVRISIIGKETNTTIEVLEKIKQNKNYSWVKL